MARTMHSPPPDETSGRIFMGDQPRRESVEDPDATVASDKDESTANEESIPERKKDVETDAFIEDRFEATDN